MCLVCLALASVSSDGFVIPGSQSVLHYWLQPRTSPVPRQSSSNIRMGGAGVSTSYDIMRILHRKNEEVKQLLQRHSEPMDPLQLRLGYANSKSSYRLRRTLRRNKDLQDRHQIAVISDIKRYSPIAVPHQLSDFGDISPVVESYIDAGCDLIMVNTDSGSYGGSIDDLRGAVKAARKSADDPGPPVIMKDFIIHPIQLALAVENGAAGAVVVAGILGAGLEDMMNAATIMGTELIVEIHTPAEAAKVMEYGPNAVMINQWDRVTGQLHPKQALGLRHMFPNEVLTIAAGGLSSPDDIARLSDAGYDAVVLGRSLVTSPDPYKLIKKIRDRQGLERGLLGMGFSAEDLDIK